MSICVVNADLRSLLALIITDSKVENHQFVEVKMARYDNDSTPIHIGTDRQLFVDDFWIAEAQDVTRRLHEPVRREIGISAEHPWERGGVSYKDIRSRASR